MSILIHRIKPFRGRERREYYGRGIRLISSHPHELFQLRVRVGPLKNDSVNFGLYRSVLDAKRVRSMVSRLWRPPMSIWDVMRQLQGEGMISPKLLPRWVYRREDGRYGARVIIGPRKCHLEGPFETADEAHDVMRRNLGMPPLGPRVSQANSVASNKVASKSEPRAVPSASVNRLFDIS